MSESEERTSLGLHDLHGKTNVIRTLGHGLCGSGFIPTIYALVAYSRPHEKFQCDPDRDRIVSTPLDRVNSLHAFADI